MRGNKVLFTALGLSIACVFIIAAYLGYHIDKSKVERPVIHTLFEAKIRSMVNDTTGEQSFQLGVVDSGFTIKQSNNHYEVYLEDNLVGKLSLQTELLKETGDYYYFITYMPIVTLEEPLVLRASIESESREANYRFISYPTHEEKIAAGTISEEAPPDLKDGVLHEPILLTKGTDLPQHSLYVDGGDFSLHLNRVNIYEPLENGVRWAKDKLSPRFVYRHKDIRVGQEDYANLTTTNKNNSRANTKRHTLEITLPHLEGHEIEQWGLVGQADMFGWDEEEQRNLYLVANLDRVRKWTQGGFQYITPTTYYPYDLNGFWVVPAQHVGNRLLLSGKDRFSTNITLLSLESALATQLKEGMWVTQPRSEWLYDDYGIEAGFYDTRFSTDAGLFLIYGYREFGEPMYLEGARKYADFLVEFARSHHFETENGGYLVWDYRDGVWDGITKKETHVSLNHLVTEMNFLYEVYKELEETQLKENIDRGKIYLQTAEKMRIAVQDTQELWKKEENGDLWYAYMPDGTYGLLDYPLLTLKDLRYSQELIEEIFGDRDAAFEHLIEIKEAYLVEQGMPLYD